MLESAFGFLRREGRFVFLLLTFFFMLGVSPFITDQGLGKWLMNILFSLLLLSSLYAVSDRRRLMIVGAIACAAGIVLRWANFFYPTPALAGVTAGAHAVFFMSAAIAMLSHVLRMERVTFDAISAALSVYLLFGLTWGVAFMVLELLAPGSFLVQGRPIPFTGTAEGSAEESMRWIYYSYVTLTTLGYGDIVPATARAQGLAIVEAILGQLYLAVLVARLVGLHIAYASGRTER